MLAYRAPIASAHGAWSQMWLSAPPARVKQEGWLAATCALLFISLWIDKGIGLVIVGFVPNMLEEVTAYIPSFQEIMITLAVWATGFFILTGPQVRCSMLREGLYYKEREINVQHCSASAET